MWEATVRERILGGRTASWRLAALWLCLALSPQDVEDVQPMEPLFGVLELEAWASCPYGMPAGRGVPTR